MKVRGGFLLVTCATSALLIGAGAISSASAADQDMVLKAPPAPEAGWWWHGDVEVGGRFFLNNPSRNGTIAGPYNQGNSLAKFYEYRDLRPGPFGNIYLGAGSRDGLYGIDFWAKNIGYDDQSYFLDMSKAGEHYVTLGWDETPHLYSTSARTLYNGVGSNYLTVPNSVRNQLWQFGSNGPQAIDTTQVGAIVNGNAVQTDIGIRRDTGSLNYRWTPNADWDVRVDYSNMHRSGTQIQGVVFTNSPSGIIVESPKPVHDTTQNFGTSGEYAGTSFWGKKFNFKVAYAGSVYTGDDFYDVQNPFRNDANMFINTGTGTGGVGTSACTTTTCAPFFARMSLWPDNSANAISGVLGADLPGNSRYTGSYVYNMMRQNQSYLPFTSNPNLFIGTTPANSVAALPFTSLDGEINTLLINNAVTTQITPDLRSKLTYRYFDYQNDTAAQLFNTIVATDYVTTTTSATGLAVGVSPYRKQNAGAELTWHPLRPLTTGFAYGFERYDWSRNDVDVTNEHSGKFYSTYRATDWMSMRASYLYSARRFENYTNTVANLVNSWNRNYRNPELADRDQQKGKYQVDFDVAPTVVVSPFAGFQLRHYDTDPFAAKTLGILKDNSWNAGVEVAFTPVAGTTFLASYTFEDYDKRIVGAGNPNAANRFGTNGWDTSLKDKVNTFTAAVNQDIIPNTLDLKLSYVISRAVGDWNTTPLVSSGFSGYTPNCSTLSSTPCPVYPATHNNFQRLDAILSYKVDQDFVRRMGWQGQVIVRARYAYERNSMDNFQWDGMQPYMMYGAFGPANAITATSNGGAQTIWMAWNNPNYNVHLMAVSASFKW